MNCVHVHGCVQVYDYEASGHHRLLGQADTSAAKLREMVASGATLALTNPRQPGKPAGTLSVKSFNVEVGIEVGRSVEEGGWSCCIQCALCSYTMSSWGLSWEMQCTAYRTMLSA